MAFTPQPFPLAPASPAGVNLMSVEPKNWRRYPGKVITKAMTDPADLPAKDVTYTGGVANVGAAAGNDGETGTLNSTSTSRGQGWMTQAEKAAALGTTMAVDVTKSYAGDRGEIEAHEPYPTVNTMQVPPEFRDSNYVVPEVLP